jgi:hypothetical protein
MRRTTLAAVAAAAIIGAFSFGAPAGAVPATGSVPAITNAGSLVNAAVMVVKKKGHKKTVWVYNRKRHGIRYRARRAGFGYYYGGYWYARPWWTPGLNICIGC